MSADCRKPTMTYKDISPETSHDLRKKVPKGVCSAGSGAIPKG